MEFISYYTRLDVFEWMFSSECLESSAFHCHIPGSCLLVCYDLHTSSLSLTLCSARFGMRGIEWVVRTRSYVGS